MLELSSRPTATTRASVAMVSQQSRRLLLALALLLAALAAVLIKDRDFWFGDSSATVEPYTPQISPAAQTPVNSAAQPSPTVQAHTSKKELASAAVATPAAPEEAPAVTAKRTILPPLDVEVVAGGKHSKVHPGSNATKLEIATPASKSTPQIEAATNAAQHEALAKADQPSYPPLAQHMNVQGSVVLQALIGADGVIENLRVTSGPAILAAAAQQAVREWHFKPILQNGQPVESKATITVNFSIKVADNSANATIAESRPEQILVLTR